VAALGVGGCARTMPPQVRPLDVEVETEGARLSRLAAHYWDLYLAADPIEATIRGDHRFDDRVPDLSPSAREHHLGELSALRDRVGAIKAQSLAMTDQITRTMLLQRIDQALAEEICHFDEWRGGSRNGWPGVLLSLGTLQPLDGPASARALLARWHLMPQLLATHVENLRRGLAQDWVAARVEVTRVVRQLDALLAQPDEEWPLAAPAKAPHPWWKERDQLPLDVAFKQELTRTVSKEVRPAYAALRDFLRDSVLPKGRDDEHAGLSTLPFGRACYTVLIEAETSMPLAPSEVHRMGREEMGKIHAEIADLGLALFHSNNLSVIQERVRQKDPSLAFASRDEILAAAEGAVNRAKEVLPHAFATLPRTKIEVRPIEAQEERDAPSAYYREPPSDGSRPGIYYVNTWEPTSQRRYESDVLAFHEALPGHHLQIALAAEMRHLPAFRRQVGVTAFIEGWALYAERLADELDLYSSDEARLGMLAFDAWRAGRLVVDSGMHALGWSRAKAVAYLLANTLATSENIENEVDRYLTWPAQALAYKVGQREILRLRADAENELGENFDLRQFHAAVLGQGAVSLPVLDEVVSHWIVTTRRGARERPSAETPSTGR